MVLNLKQDWRLINVTANIALAPVAGPLGRTALGGRNWEGFAVDPYLSGILSAETIKGIQDAGVMANLKVNKSPNQSILEYNGLLSVK